jgi:hypothetical protein
VKPDRGSALSAAVCILLALAILVLMIWIARYWL